MTEMIEVANILNNATKKSFIIFDELGRGTSTYDGLALTKAILHYILQTLQAKTLIATHYHELIALEQESPLIKNFSVSVYETDKQVIFMKKIKENVKKLLLHFKSGFERFPITIILAFLHFITGI